MLSKDEKEIMSPQNTDQKNTEANRSNKDHGLEPAMPENTWEVPGLRARM